MKGALVIWASKGLRTGVGVASVSIGAWKLFVGSNPAAWVSGSMFYFSAGVELMIGFGALATRATWPMWLGMVCGASIIALGAAHAGDPRPCGCLGLVDIPPAVRIVYGATMGAACSLVLAMRATARGSERVR